MQEQNKCALMITLGHNSSAVFFNGIDKPVGYEEERLTLKKSDSSFPSSSINKIIENIDDSQLYGARIFISHWFDNFDQSSFPDKYFNHFYINNLCKKYDMKIVNLSENFTHHDAHAYSSLAFILEKVERKNLGDFHFLVADGFGNNEEVMSFYRYNTKTGKLELQSRYYDYMNSMGLMYQYACSYCGMKENQDEYKFLGYEAHILDYISRQQLRTIEELADTYIENYLKILGIFKQKKEKTHEGYIDVEALMTAESIFNIQFDNVMKTLQSGSEEIINHLKRHIIGYYIQYCVENIMTKLISSLNVKNIVLSGGCFYNVKLNNAIKKTIEGDICVMPLSGDQGAAIGMYQKYIGDFKFFDLCYGVRSLDHKVEDSRIMHFTEPNEFISKVAQLINEDKVVNIIQGDLEFGPRALCNTSTLALPTKENVDYINMLNSRNTVMPMAPVLLEKNYIDLFRSHLDRSRVIRSNEYMIITDDFNEDAVEHMEYRGVMHKYPKTTNFSGRPQVISRCSQSNISSILENVNSLCVINTSFNTHGNPIVCSSVDAVIDFRKQKLKDVEQKTYLLILDDKNR